MSSEIGSLDSSDYDSYHDSYSLESDLAPEIANLHTAIYVPENESRFTKAAILRSKESLSSIEHRTDGIARFFGTEIILAKNGGNVEVELGISSSWGGRKGVEISGYLTGEARDDRGNSARITVEQKSNGEGSVNASAKYSDDLNSEDNKDK